jgi:hypothetical protein
MSLWRAAAAVISDLCANYAQDFLNNWAGRTGEVLIIAGALTAYAWYTRRHGKKTVRVVGRPSRVRIVRARTALTPRRARTFRQLRRPIRRSRI